tara:strand:+ start:1926 stop:2792 length:867 start_codon:yes stop_codon:yes gene_type:complete
MGVETATFISQLSATNPLATDPISEGDDQIRLVKEVLQAQFTSLGAVAVTGTAAELNKIDGYTGTTAELNYLDITTLGQSEQSKALTADANGDVKIEDGAFDFDVASHDGTNGLLLGGTLVTASATELNKIDGYTGTTAELNYNDVTSLGTVEVSKTVTATAAGLINHADYQVQRPYFLDIAETINVIGATGGGTQDIDITVGNVVTATVDTNANTFTFSNPSATGRSCSFLLILTNGGSQTVNWPGTVDWAGGAAPSLTSSGIDVICFSTIDAGSIWYGFAAGLAMA